MLRPRYDQARVEIGRAVGAAVKEIHPYQMAAVMVLLAASLDPDYHV